jgi:hypothetical protein
MAEAPADAIRSLAEASIPVHRVHVSSALRGDGDPASLQALAKFDESRYLHQVVAESAEAPRVWADIGDFIAAGVALPWRCHFHVPIFLERFAGLATTATTIEPLLASILAAGHRPFVEVETYAWGRFPEALDCGLEEGLAREILHARSLLAKCGAGAHAAHR